MVGGAAGFHDDQADGSILEPALELATGQAMLLDDFPFVICNSNLEYTLGKINGHGSSMHFGLLSSKTDPRPHEHRWRPLGARKAGESIPSLNRMLRLSAHRR